VPGNDKDLEGGWLMHRTTILLVSRYVLDRKGLRALLGGDREVDVVGEAGSEAAALEKVDELAPDVVVMDLSCGMPEVLALSQKIKAGKNRPAILILSGKDEEKNASSLMESGISGLVSRDAPVLELLGAIQALKRGKMYFDVQPEQR
jgi:DNA-binding NarL/FixJ family response regulator